MLFKYCVIYIFWDPPANVINCNCDYVILKQLHLQLQLDDFSLLVFLPLLLGASLNKGKLQIQVMKTFGWEPSEEELKDMVNVIDADGDGDISFNEFVWLMTR